MKNDTTGAMLRGMVFPRFITKPPPNVDFINSSITNPENWLDAESFYKDTFILNSVANYLFKYIKNSNTEIILSEKRNQKMSLVLENLFKENECDVKRIIINMKDKKEFHKEEIENKNICFVDDALIERKEVIEIEDLTVEVNANLVSYVTLFNFEPPIENPVKVVSLFSLDDIQRYKIWDLIYP